MLSHDERPLYVSKLNPTIASIRYLFLLPILWIIWSLPTQAQAFYQREQSSDILQNSRTVALETLEIYTIGLRQYEQGQFQAALNAFQDFLALAKTFPDRDRVREVIALNRIGLVYLALGQDERGLDFFQQALTIQAGDDPKVEGAILDNIGFAYARLKQYRRALEFLQRAIARHREAGNRIDQGTTLSRIGSVYYNLENYDRAQDAYQQALYLYEQVGDAIGEGIALDGQGNVYAKLGQTDAALASFQKALAIYRRVKARPWEANTLIHIGRVLFTIGQLTDAETTLTEAIAIFESLREELSDANRITFFETQLLAYTLLQQVLVSESKPDAALEVAERGRARALVELLRRRLNADTSSVTPPPPAPSIADMQRIAQQHGTLVQYSIIPSDEGTPSLYIWVVQPTGAIAFRSVHLSDLRQSLASLIDSSREVIGARNRNPATIVVTITPDAQRQQRYQQKAALQTLYQLFIEPIADLLPTEPDQRVIVIPQGELFLVPFAALMDRNGQYLIQHHTLLTAPSIQVLDLTRSLRQKEQEQPADWLIVGNPTMPAVWNPVSEQQEPLPSLPGAEAEAMAIAQFLATTPLLQGQATETTVVQRMTTAHVIHLATHGLLEYGDPQESDVRDVPGAIALAPDQTNDGLLTSAEISEMTLQAELVVLSACNTGQGQIKGDGVIGLSRSLIQAGVPSVIVSLWAVPDAPTATLMTEFYRQWQQSGDKAQALRQAMLMTLQHYPEPRNWAAFTLIGEAF